MEYRQYAEREFKLAGWLNDDGTYCDPMQEKVCNHILHLLDEFFDGGHSGSSGAYVLNVFDRLARYMPLQPLTGEDEEWEEKENGQFQNTRCSRVFKKDGKAYDIEGKVFSELLRTEDGEEYEARFTNKDSHVPVEFPYTPSTEYVRILDRFF